MKQAKQNLASSWSLERIPFSRCPDNGITQDVGVTDDPLHVPGCVLMAKCEKHTWKCLTMYRALGSRWKVQLNSWPLQPQIMYMASDFKGQTTSISFYTRGK